MFDVKFNLKYSIIMFKYSSLYKIEKILFYLIESY